MYIDINGFSVAGGRGFSVELEDRFMLLLERTARSKGDRPFMWKHKDGPGAWRGRIGPIEWEAYGPSAYKPLAVSDTSRTTKSRQKPVTKQATKRTATGRRKAAASKTLPAR